MKLVLQLCFILGIILCLVNLTFETCTNVTPISECTSLCSCMWCFPPDNSTEGECLDYNVVDCNNFIMDWNVCPTIETTENLTLYVFLGAFFGICILLFICWAIVRYYQPRTIDNIEQINRDDV